MPRPLSLSIHDWIVPWRERPWPPDWEAEFGRRAPLALEIGFGNGEFLAREAARRPERNHLGIELSWTSATHLLRRLDPDATPHVRALLVDAEVALEHLFAPASLCALFLHHPCPWPKERHHRRRIVRPETLARMADRLEPGAPLTIVTDHHDYAAWIAEVLEGQVDLVPQHGTTEEAVLPGHEPTKYQRKAMAQGVDIHYFRWVRPPEPGRAAVRPSPPPAPDAMPSLTLQGHLAGDDLFAGFEPGVHTEDHDGVPVVVKLVGAYRRTDEGPWLVRVLTQEGPLRQEFALEVAPRDAGRLLIKLSSLGSPHPTAAVKRAVWHAAAWLRAAHPQLEIQSHNLGAPATAEVSR